MIFSTERSTEKGLDQIIIRDNSSGTSVTILPKYGAMLNGFSVINNGSAFNVIDNHPDELTASTELEKSFKSSKLSPFACRIPAGQYTFNGKLYEISKKFIDGTAIHGLLYNKAFTVVNEFADDENGSVLLKYNYKKEDPGYPFEYRCEIAYTLLPGNLLQLQTTVINLGDETIPMADGWHPYIQLGGKVNDWLFSFNAEAMVEFNDKLIPTGQLVEYDHFNEEKPIGDLFLDNCFLLKRDEMYAACTLYNPDTKMGISFFPDESYPYLQVYTPPHRNSIAIENLSGAPDCFNNKMGLTLLQPRHTQTFTAHYKVEID